MNRNMKRNMDRNVKLLRMYVRDVVDLILLTIAAVFLKLAGVRPGDIQVEKNKSWVLSGNHE